MDIEFVNPGVDYMIQRIMDVQTEAESAFGLNPYTVSIRSLIKPMLSVYLSPKGTNTLSEQCEPFMPS